MKIKNLIKDPIASGKLASKVFFDKLFYKLAEAQAKKFSIRLQGCEENIFWRQGYI